MSDAQTRSTTCQQLSVRCQVLTLAWPAVLEQLLNMSVGLADTYIVGHLGGAQKRIQMRQTAIFHKADPEYGTRVGKGLELDVKDVERLAAMSQEERVKATAEGAYA